MTFHNDVERNTGGAKSLKSIPDVALHRNIDCQKCCHDGMDHLVIYSRLEYLFFKVCVLLKCMLEPYLAPRNTMWPE